MTGRRVKAAWSPERGFFAALERNARGAFIKGGVR